MTRSRRGIVAERIAWLVEYAEAYGHFRIICLSDQDLVEAFVAAFPEAKATQTGTMFGYMPTPLLQRAARQAWREGKFARRVTSGNEDCKSRGYCTYSVSYTRW